MNWQRADVTAKDLPVSRLSEATLRLSDIVNQPGFPSRIEIEEDYFSGTQAL